MTAAPTLGAIIRAVAAESGVTEGYMIRRCRRRRFSRPRQVVFYLARTHTKLTFTQIARYMERHHKTVRTGALLVSHRKDADEFRDLVRGAERRLGMGQ